MINPRVNIVEFDILYKILHEIKENLNFKLQSFQTINEFLSTNKEENYTIITKSKNIIENNNVDKRKVLLFDELPMNVDLLIEKINIQLIKQKYNFFSNFNIKNYILNLNSRIISKNEKRLKLTEREIDILLHLHENKLPQNIETLQKKVWGYSLELETHTVETHIYRLRKKIKDEFHDDNFILSHEKGYTI
tara:strand:+ start:266 stop:841 length:576 start_codon:yes stop_codon:yes gene_type:complete